MPTARHVTNERPSPAYTNSQNRFTLPIDNHLLVTTASHILAWDRAGIHTIFKSSKSSIVAAREAKDGSGILAVADKYIVGLHDTKRGQERSWGLEADNDEVRHLEYTADAKSLFLSTNLTSDIQRYSTERSRLLSPSRSHASPPVALAVSPTGHLMVSASDNPPLVYLKNLIHNSTPVLIETRASQTAVSVITFHPERPNIFLLAFRDGTLAAFDATKIARNSHGAFSNQQSVNSTEIAHLPKVHRTTSGTSRAVSIAGVAFLPGYKTRVISVGGDGRCRIVDFTDGGAVLRTWHAKAPVTSVSVISRKVGTDARNRTVGSRSSHTIGGPTSNDNLIAIGRADGVVQIYDSVGLLLDERRLDESGHRILSVEWAKGSSPKPISDTVMARQVEHLPYAEVKTAETKVEQAAPNSTPKARSTARARRSTNFEHVGLPLALRKPKEASGQPKTGAARRFTIHPDEIEEGTVRHIPLLNNPNFAGAGQAQYLDLFSPVKPAAPRAAEPEMRRLASPPRNRPKMSSQTFVKSPQPVEAGLSSSVARQRNLALFPSTSTASGSETAQPSARKAKQHIVGASPLASRQHIAFKPRSQRRVRKSGSFQLPPAATNTNAGLLAELRRMGGTSQRAGGVTPAPVPEKISQSQSQAIKESAFSLFRRPKDHVETELDAGNALNLYEHMHKKQHWPEDSTQASSLDGDIWLTSESDTQTTHRRRRRQRAPERPPARQTSRSRINDQGTMSTVAQQPAPLSLNPAPKMNAVDGSTDEEMHTAGTHVSPSGTFSPSSNDVRELFPRSSSLSPRRRHRSQRKQLLRSTVPQDMALREVTLNAALTRPVKSPWARAKAKKARHGLENNNERVGVLDENLQLSDGATAPHEPHCNVCGPTKARVHELESEVARLKGEMLVLKSVLRRQGVPMPACFR
ncbi:hypothetical protein LTR37_009478 [Vermiconidia calcicola]|uniref:Uncharacterized protein n=1 Tax=Vermiconidia calcicola TaxID=1690605 RepID=A0ACC3N8Z2_9PEZI|nr:hypothetical protein LTR37_009478 [Vermiconidia calcicola]